MNSANPYGVKPGQVWRDNDARRKDADGVAATVTVDKLEKDASGNLRACVVRSHSGRTSKILLYRFGGTKGGFTKVSD